MVEIGQISRPNAEDFAGRKKLYCVASVYDIENAPDEYKKLADKYWDEVAAQIEKIEAAGKIKKIFCEIISEESDKTPDLLAKIHRQIPEIIRKKRAEGGSLIPLESEEILGTYTDWANCLRVVFSKEVFTKVLEFYHESSERRLNHILSVIENNLAEGEAGLLIMKDEDRAKLQFPKDVEIFLITPPSYDDILRWVRDRMTERMSKKEGD